MHHDSRLTEFLGSSVRWRTGLAAAAAVLIGVWSGRAQAQLTTTVTGTGQYVFNSNVFDLQRGFASGEARVGRYIQSQYNQADWYYSYGAGLNLSEQISQQTFYLRGTDTQYEYDHFTQLTHNEYNVDAGWLYQLGSAVSGTLDVSRYRTMVPFYQIVSVTLSLDTDQREQATLNFQIMPKLRFETNGYIDKLQEPLPGEPYLSLADSGGGGDLRYLGTNQWSATLNAAYQHGDYNNAILFFSPSYNQWTYGLGASYQPTGAGSASTFDFNIGKTSRTSPFAADDVSGITGHLDYTRQLTGKTSITAAFDRSISSFLTFAGSDIGTSGTVSANWQATYKIGVNLAYSLIYAYFPDQGFIAGTSRGDHLQVATLNVSYAALDWLAIRPFANYQTRSSNYYGANFNDTIYGVSVVIQWPRLATPTTSGAALPTVSTGLPF